MNHGRRREHLDDGGRIYIPEARMRHIRWEEAVANARARRRGGRAEIHHHTCHCGSIECVAVPIDISAIRGSAASTKEPKRKSTRR